MYIQYLVHCTQNHLRSWLRGLRVWASCSPQHAGASCRDIYDFEVSLSGHSLKAGHEMYKIAFVFTRQGYWYVTYVYTSKSDSEVELFTTSLKLSDMGFKLKCVLDWVLQAMLALLLLCLEMWLTTLSLLRCLYSLWRQVVRWQTSYKYGYLSCTLGFFRAVWPRAECRRSDSHRKGVMWAVSLWPLPGASCLYWLVHGLAALGPRDCGQLVPSPRNLLKSVTCPGLNNADMGPDMRQTVTPPRISARQLSHKRQSSCE